MKTAVKKSEKLTCEGCGKVLKTARGLSIHAQRCHKGSFHQAAKTSSKRIFTPNKDGTFSCPFCDYTCIHPVGLSQHCRASHKEEYAEHREKVVGTPSKEKVVSRFRKSIESRISKISGTDSYEKMSINDLIEIGDMLMETLEKIKKVAERKLSKRFER